MTAKDWEDVIRSFFSRSTFCSPDVLHRIVGDLSSVRSTFSLSLQVAAWGTTNQERLCLYGKLWNQQEVLPIQVWLTHLYPVDPPTIFALSPDMGIIAESGREVDISAVVKTPHPNIDNTGLCYCTTLSQWNPRDSSLRTVLLDLSRELVKNGYPLHYYCSSPQQKVSLTTESGVLKEWRCAVCFMNANMVVFIPCGHCCCCQSCASNLPACPLCRKKIELRQIVLHSD